VFIVEERKKAAAKRGVMKPKRAPHKGKLDHLKNQPGKE